VLKVELHDDKIRKKAMQTASGISGKESQRSTIFAMSIISFIFMLWFVIEG